MKYWSVTARGLTLRKYRWSAHHCTAATKCPCCTSASGRQPSPPAYLQHEEGYARSNEQDMELRPLEGERRHVRLVETTHG